MDYKEKIMEEFMRQFIQKDCKEIKVDNIAENLGISKRTIYEIFSSKDEIIKQTLDYYQTLNHEGLLKICNENPNPLRRILSVCFAMIHDTSQINVARLLNLKKNYPELAGELIKKHGLFLTKTLGKSFIKSQKQGFIFEEVDSEMILYLLASGEKDHRQRKVQFMNSEFDTLEMFSMHLFTIIRGICTLKGIEICDSFYVEKFIEKK